MSDYIVKIVPKDPKYCVSEHRINDILLYLKNTVVAEHIEGNLYETPQFIDCGSNLEKIYCPVCSKVIGVDWWAEKMDIASENNFEDLEVKLPCCGNKSSLNDLQYHFSCGFACIVFELFNPTTELTSDCIVSLEKLLGTYIRVIQSHL